jgi:hypothetical protein
LLNGKKGEKSKSHDPAQLSVFEEGQTPIAEPEKEKITYTHTKKAANQNHPGRNKLPENLLVEEQVIEPEEDTTDMVKIGQEVSETTEYKPATLFIQTLS